jgi:hypothetical protein
LWRAPDAASAGVPADAACSIPPQQVVIAIATESQFRSIVAFRESRQLRKPPLATVCFWPFCEMRLAGKRSFGNDGVNLLAA